MTVALRPVSPADESFLLRLYASTRADELALVDWSEPEKEAFVRHQFDAQSRHYAQHYPTATHDVILIDGEQAGRLYVERWSHEIRIVDISLLPVHRDRGVGAELLRGVQEEGAASGRAVSIHVERFNPARRLYARLGFQLVEEGQVHQLMRWSPEGCQPSSGSGG